jgi:protein TonB
VFGQETKKVTVKNDFPDSKEVFYVLKSDNSIKHGSYEIRYNISGVRITGYYKNGIKDGFWTEYRKDGNKKNEGLYEGENRIGVWNFYDKNGVLEQKYDYTKKEMLLYTKSDNATVDLTVAYAAKTADRSPIYIGGNSAIIEFVENIIEYPKIAVQKGITGTTFIRLTVDTLGKSGNFGIAKGFDSDCDAEALRVAKALPDNWIPGQKDGHKVNIWFILPVTFKRK